MSIVSVDKEALDKTKNAISKYVFDMKNAIKNAVDKFKALYGEWCDEDFDNLMTSFMVIDSDIQQLEVISNQIISRIKIKLEQIEQLHNIQI